MYGHKIPARGRPPEGDRRARGSAMREGIGAEPGGRLSNIGPNGVAECGPRTQLSGAGGPRVGSNRPYGDERRAVEDLAREAQIDLVASCDTFMSAKIQ
jgi:hypothetical protein